jgi:hypothetical protein
MVKEIEKFSPEFDRRSLADMRSFVEREVPIVDSRTMEEAAIRISRHTEDFGREWCGRKVLMVLTLPA